MKRGVSRRLVALLTSAVLLFVVSNHRVATAFRATPTLPAVRLHNDCRLYSGKRSNKLGMAEKRARRNKRIRSRPDLSHVPPSKLDFQAPPYPSKPSTEHPVNADQEKQATASAQTAAQQLVDSQRESVAMLTAVQEAWSRLPKDQLSQSLEQHGYYFCDHFLEDDRILQQLQNEGVALLDSNYVAQDLERLGSGDFIAPIQGGSEQYAVCPRSIEWVVASTKHFPLQSSQQLSSVNCMATMRTFDRRAWQASLKLLTAAPAHTCSSLDQADPAERVERSFATIVKDASDLRRVSVRYYVVPDGWNEEYGGGTSFSDTNRISAKRDCLVIWDSVKTKVCEEAWKGASGTEKASCLELHLVADQQ